MIEKVQKMNQLLDQYSELLTEKQREVALDYYQEDLSLQEIADNSEVSKNAIYDTLKRTEALLLDYEEKLHLVFKQEKLSELFENLMKLENEEINELLKRYQEENNE